MKFSLHPCGLEGLNDVSGNNNSSLMYQIAAVDARITSLNTELRQNGN